ncbi:MAG: hypothetical protein ACKVOQ_22895 [Cyclobacteriaceae bacterium]
MKKLIYTVSTVMLIALSSCKNENSVNPRPVDQIISKAVIAGLVRAELNNTTPSPAVIGGVFANAELIPASLAPKVVAEIDTRDLVLNPIGIAYAKKYYEATVGADGSYSIEVEVGPKGFIDVTLYYSNFRSDLIVSTSTTLKNLVFNGGSQQITVNKGRNEIAPDYTIFN